MSEETSSPLSEALQSMQPLTLSQIRALGAALASNVGQLHARGEANGFLHMDAFVFCGAKKDGSFQLSWLDPKQVEGSVRFDDLPDFIRWSQPPEALLTGLAPFARDPKDIFDASCSADCWAVGCILATVYAGRHPFRSTHAGAQMARIARAMGNPGREEVKYLSDDEFSLLRLPSCESSIVVDGSRLRGLGAHTSLGAVGVVLDNESTSGAVSSVMDTSLHRRLRLLSHRLAGIRAGDRHESSLASSQSRLSSTTLPQTSREGSYEEALFFHLLSSLLCYDVRSRMSIKDCLRHPFFHLRTLWNSSSETLIRPSTDAKTYKSKSEKNVGSADSDNERTSAAMMTVGDLAMGRDAVTASPHASSINKDIDPRDKEIETNDSISQETNKFSCSESCQQEAAESFEKDGHGVELNEAVLVALSTSLDKLQKQWSTIKQRLSGKLPLRSNGRSRRHRRSRVSLHPLSRSPAAASKSTEGANNTSQAVTEQKRKQQRPPAHPKGPSLTTNQVEEYDKIEDSSVSHDRPLLVHCTEEMYPANEALKLEATKLIQNKLACQQRSDTTVRPIDTTGYFDPLLDGICELPHDATSDEDRWAEYTKHLRLGRASRSRRRKERPRQPESCSSSDEAGSRSDGRFQRKSMLREPVHSFEASDDTLAELRAAEEELDRMLRRWRHAEETSTTRAEPEPDSLNDLTAASDRARFRDRLIDRWNL